MELKKNLKINFDINKGRNYNDENVKKELENDFTGKLLQECFNKFK